ncbi:MAG: hypothetical protein WBJ62_05740 [Coriobacteriia bacterium]
MRSMLNRESKSDDGVALITVLGVITIITVLAVGSFTIARQALSDSERVEAESAAFRVAQSGLDRHVASFEELGSTVTTYPPGTTPDGTYQVTVENLGVGQYRLVSTGTAHDGSVERVAQEFWFMNLWKMNFAGTGEQSLVSGAKKISGGSNIVGPFYMKGSLEINSSMLVAEGPIFVRTAGQTGGILYNQGQFGLKDAPVDVFCDGDITALRAQAQADLGSVNPKVVLGQTRPSVPDIKTPDIDQGDLDEWLSLATAESVDNRMGADSMHPIPIASPESLTGQASEYTSVSATYTRAKADPTGNLNYKFIGDPSGIVVLGSPKTTGLHISATTPSFGWWGPTNANGVVLPGSNPVPSQHPVNVHDDFAWDALSQVLYVEGTVFIDGPLTIDPNVRYVGNGSIVVNGDITINGYFRPAGTDATQGRDNKWAVGLVTPTTITFTSQSAAVGSPTPQALRDQLADGAGAFFGQESVNFPAKFLMQGSVIAGAINAPDNNFYLVTNPLLPQYLPDALPGAQGGMMFPSRWMRY